MPSARPLDADTNDPAALHQKIGDPGLHVDELPALVQRVALLPAQADDLVGAAEQLGLVGELGDEIKIDSHEKWAHPADGQVNRGAAAGSIPTVTDATNLAHRAPTG